MTTAKSKLVVVIFGLVAIFSSRVASAQTELAPGPSLRAVYLATNPAQAQRNVQTGEYRGVSFDLAAELARRLGKPLDFRPVSGPPAVIEAVRSGAADIGFVAYESTRVGTVEFSQTYMLVHQSFLVSGDSPIKTVLDIDQQGRKIADTRNDSITLCLGRALKQATSVTLENHPETLGKALASREVDAFGANRARLTALSRSIPGMRLLPDNFFNVPQTIIVPKGRPEALSAVNAFIDSIRASGLLREAVQKSGVIGIEAAAAGPTSQHGCPG